jgi:protein-glucosylgalactosylhydroxylysine glucosidase
MVAYDGRESPSTIGPFLIWQQPHPIYYAELLYRHRGDEAVLHRFKDIVFASADFMASYPQLDIAGNRYVLGPPLIPAQEIYKPDETFNPAFELAYWKYGLETAQTWRERLKLPRDKKWDEVLKRLSALPIKDGLYQNAGNALNTFEDAFHRNDHPSVLGAFGMLPNAAIDRKAMTRTLERVLESWNWQRTWGWDYPMIAMNAARLGRPELAVEALLMDVPKNRYLNNGHNYQDERLPLYLPGNGGLLAAVAMMAAGWEGAPAGHAPGFPKNGLWTVRYEGLMPLQ